MVGSAERRPTEDRCDLSSRIAKTMRDPQSRINDQATLRTRTRRRGPWLALGMTEGKTPPNLAYSEGDLESAFPHGLKVAVSDLWPNS